MRKNRQKQRKQVQTVNAEVDSSTQTLPPVGGNTRILFWIIPALVAINIYIYAQVRDHEFIHWDDPGYVTQNYEVSQGLTWEGVHWAFTTGRQSNWHPLTWLSHMLDVRLFGLSPRAHHIINLLFHIANTLLLFWILFQMTASAGRSAFVAGIFAAHPLHVESVAWIAERKDVLCAFFLLLTIWAYAAFVRKPDVQRYLLIIVLFAFALMSKPMAVTLPIILLLLDFWPLGRVNPGSGQISVFFPLIREKAPLFLMSLGSGIVTILVQWHGGAVATMDVYSLDSRVANALASYVAYLKDMLWPAGLSAFYPYRSLPALWIIVCFLFLAGASVIASRFAARHPFIIVGWMWYLATLTPAIGLIQVGAQAKADRYTYLPLIGIFIIIAWGIPKILGGLPALKIPLAIAGCALICALAFAAHSQAAYWANGVELWSHAIQSNPNSYAVHLNLGNELYNSGKNDKAIAHFKDALRLNPNSAEVHNSLAIALIKQGRSEEGIEHFRQALRIDPDYEEAHCYLGAILTESGKLDEAISHLSTALKMNPNDSLAQYQMGLALSKKGKNDEAIVHFFIASRLNPGLANANHRLGNAMAKQGKMDEAITQFEEALRLNPYSADAHSDLGNALAVQGRIDEAIIHYKEALRIKPSMAAAHNGLANALSRQGKLDEAMAQYKEALRNASNNPDAYYNLGNLMARQGRLDEAIAQYKEALRIMPDMAEAHNSWGDVNLSKRQVNEAIIQYKEALRIKPDYIAALYNLGTTLLTQGSLDDAIACLTDVLKMNPDNVGAHANLGIALIYKGRKQEAIPHLKEALRAQPDDKTLKGFLEKASKR